MGKLTLDGNVSLQRLQQFAQEAGDQSIRLKEKNGVQILYTSNKVSTGLKNFLTGQTDERRDAGRAKLAELLGQHAENARTAIGANANTNRLDNLPQGTKLTGTTLSAAIGDVQNAITSKVSERTNEARLARAQGDAAMGGLALKWGDPAGRQGAVQQLGKSLATKIHSKFSKDPGLAAKQRATFLTTPNDNLVGLKNAYLKQLAQDAGPQGAMFTTTYENASAEVKKFVDDVFNHAAANLPGNSLGKKGEDGVFHEISINGQTYVHDKKLAEGGFGNVHLYHLKSDPNQTIVLKEPKTPAYTPETGDENAIKGAKKDNAERAGFIAGTRAEAKTHLRIGNDQNVVKLLGVATDEHGAAWTALENCVHGDAFDVQMGIHDKSTNASENARTAASLTLLLDQAKGLAKMHGEGVTHQDYKSANVMVSRGGVGKIADFGTSGGAKVQGRVGGVEIKVATDKVDNPTWVSPMRLFGRDEKAAQQLAKANQLKQAAFNEVGKMLGLPSIERPENNSKPKLTDQEKQTLIQRFGDAEGKKMAKQMENDLNALVKKIDAQVEEEFAPKTMTFNEKADVWSFGVVAYQMLFDKGTDLPPQFQDRWNSDIEKKLKEHRAAGLRGEGKPIFDGPPDSLTAQEKFINWLMPPKEEDAPSMQEVVNHPIFKDLLGEGVVGSKEVRDFIESSATVYKPKASIHKEIRGVHPFKDDNLGFTAQQFVSGVEQRFQLDPPFTPPWFTPEAGKQPGWYDEIGNVLSRTPPGQLDAVAKDIIQTLNLDAKQGAAVLKAADMVRQQKASAADAQLKASRVDALMA